jgi:5-formyltetrahydrofolate cyclo-ligase
MRNNSRNTLRNKILRQRAELSNSTNALTATALLKNIQTIPQFTKSKRISAYLAMNGEMDAEATFKWARAQGKKTYLPVMKGKFLKFAELSNNTTLIPGTYNIKVPEHHTKDLLCPEDLDIVLVPLLGFDEQMNRIGMGGGYYDRSFEFKTKSALKTPTLIGIAHELQKQKAVPAEPWDVPMDYVVTEDSVYSLSVNL